MTPFETYQILKKWGIVFKRDVSEPESAAWHRIFGNKSESAFDRAWAKYHKGMNHSRWPAPKNVLDLMEAETHYIGNGRTHSGGVYPHDWDAVRVAQSLEECYGPDWREVTAKGVATLLRMGHRYGRGMLMQRRHFAELGIQLPPESQPEPEAEINIRF